MRAKYKLGEEQDAGLSKYMNKGLPLPVNTFAGIITWHGRQRTWRFGTSILSLRWQKCSLPLRKQVHKHQPELWEDIIIHLWIKRSHSPKPQRSNYLVRDENLHVDKTLMWHLALDGYNPLACLTGTKCYFLRGWKLFTELLSSKSQFYSYSVKILRLSRCQRTILPVTLTRAGN